MHISQANYAAANSCLDALAGARRGAALAGVSVQWGPWAQVGMAAGGAVNARLQAQGWGLVGLAEGLAALGLAVGGAAPPVVAMMPVSWARVLGDGVVPPFLSAFKAHEPVAAAAVPGAVPAAALSLETVLALAARTAGGAVDADAPLMEAGLDSLGAVELRNQLQQALGEGAPALPSTLVFDQPTARQLAAFLEAQHAPAALVAPPSTAPAALRSAEVVLAGTSALLPQGAAGVASVWRVSAGGHDLVGEVPASRWEPPSAAEAGGETVARRARHGAFVHGAERFDHRCFGVSAAEAGAMDPQQRLLLERGYAALHAAGLRRAELLGSATGVFVGIAGNDFAEVLKASPAGRSVYAATG